MSESIYAKGKLFELVHREQPDGRIFEVARRAPGVRVIIADLQKQELLLTREFRRELQDWDYRLPGGKVFDSLEEYRLFREGGEDIIIPAKQKAIDESIEEAGVEVKDVELFKISTLGATMEWDLFVFEAHEWRISENGQRLESGEQIETNNWFSYERVNEMILNDDLKEERIALILMQWIKKNQKGDKL